MTGTLFFCTTSHLVSLTRLGALHLPTARLALEGAAQLVAGGGLPMLVHDVRALFAGKISAASAVYDRISFSNSMMRKKHEGKHYILDNSSHRDGSFLLRKGRRHCARILNTE